MSSARYRERHSTSGAKSDAGDAHVLAEIVRLDHAHHRQVAGDSPIAEAVKLVARAHQSLIWDRTRHVLRLRAALRDFFPAAIEAFPDPDAPDVLELLAKAPDPASAARLSISQISTALKRARRRKIVEKAGRIQAALRAEHLSQPEIVVAAYAATVRSTVAILAVLNEQIAAMAKQVEIHFGQHPAAEINLVPNRGWVRSLAPGCLPSSGTPMSGMSRRRPGRTTPVPARLPAPLARRKS
jgi:transposase